MLLHGNNGLLMISVTNSQHLQARQELYNQGAELYNQGATYLNQTIHTQKIRTPINKTMLLC
jgi:hypothetical protein